MKRTTHAFLLSFALLAAPAIAGGGHGQGGHRAQARGAAEQRTEHRAAKREQRQAVRRENAAVRHLRREQRDQRVIRQQRLAQQQRLAMPPSTCSTATTTG